MTASLPASMTRSEVAADLCKDHDLTVAELRQVLDLAAQVKRTPGRFAQSLAQRYISLLFEKPSLRTRFTFELAIKQLGGDAVVSTGTIGEREPTCDMARNLERWTQAIVARTFSQNTIDELARWSRVPVINALSDLYHPCQALADAQTIQEHFGRIAGLKIAYVGDGNNVAHSLLLTLCRLGADMAVASPEGYQCDPSVVSTARGLASGSSITLTQDPAEAAADAHVLYTDVWTSMGQEDEAAARLSLFQPYQVNQKILLAARPEAVFMHCLPAKRGQEVTDDVIESPQSIVFDQAENRLHAQKALLLHLLS